MTNDFVQTDGIVDNISATLTLLLAQYSPVSAANFRGFKDCDHIQAFGTSGLLAKCRTLNDTVLGMSTPCVTQPYFEINGENFTVAHDGMTLKRFAPCYRHFSLFSLADGCLSGDRVSGRKCFPLAMPCKLICIQLLPLP